MRLRSWLVVLGLLVPTGSYADDHVADYYAAYSLGGGGSTVHGVHQTFAWETHFLNHDIAIIPADLSWQFTDDVSQVIYMFGARWTWAGDPDTPHKGLFQALVGSIHTRDSAVSVTDTDFGVALGAGYEFVKDRTWSSRVQVEAVKRIGTLDEWFPRASFGLSMRWTR